MLDWEYETISSDGTPESVKKAWATAVRMDPDAVISSGFDTAVYKAELEELKEMDIPVVNYATTDQGPTGNVTARIGDPKAVAAQGELMAAGVVADTDGKANTLFVDVPAFTILKGVARGSTPTTRSGARAARWSTSSCRSRRSARTPPSEWSRTCAPTRTSTGSCSRWTPRRSGCPPR